MKTSSIAKRTTNEEGSALVVVLLTIVALAGISAALVTRALYRFGAARGLHEADRAYQAATSGLDLALFELQQGVDLSGDAIGVTSGTVMEGSYAVTIDPPFIGPREYRLRASGRYASAGRGIEIVVTAEKEFGLGIFARDGITLTGDFNVDSYDSRLGSYASQVFGDHAGENGSIGSNWNIIANAKTVFGDANPGPTYQVLGDPSTVTGSTAPALFPRTTRAVLYSPPVPSMGDYSARGALPSGVYRYDSLRLVDDQVMTINGDVTLYVDDDFKVTGQAKIQLNPGASLTIHHGSGEFVLAGTGAVNKDATPADLTVISSTTEKIKIAGTSDFYGSVYAPEAPLSIVGDSDLYGAFVVAEAGLNGGGFLHHDESLRIPDGVTPPFRLKSAYQVSP